MVALTNYFGLQGVKQLNLKGVATPLAPNYGNLAPLEKDTFVKSETVKKERKSDDGLRVVDEFDSKTGKMVKMMAYFKDGKTPEIIAEYDSATGNKIKDTWFQEDGKTIRSIHEYDSSMPEARTRTIRFKEDGKTIDLIDEYDTKTDKMFKMTFFNDDGKTISRIDEFDDSIRYTFPIKSTFFKEDGAIDHIMTFDPKTGEEIKTSG